MFDLRFEGDRHLQHWAITNEMGIPKTDNKTYLGFRID